MKYILLLMLAATCFACKKESVAAKPEAGEEIRIMVYARDADSSIIATTPIVRVYLK